MTTSAELIKQYCNAEITGKEFCDAINALYESPTPPAGDEHPTPTVSAEEVLSKFEPNKEYPNYYHESDVIAAMHQFRTPAPEGELEKIFTREPVNFLLSNALRYLDADKLKTLTESLAERCGLKVFVSALEGEKVKELHNAVFNFLQSKRIKESDMERCGRDYAYGATDIINDTLEFIHQYKPTTPAPSDSVAAPVEVEELALSKYCTPYGKPDPCTYAFIDGYNTGYSHTPAKGEGKEEWVRVEDGLPDLSGEYFVYGRCTGENYDAVDMAMFDLNTGLFHKAYQPTHWRYLPTPPKQ